MFLIIKRRTAHLASLRTSCVLAAVAVLLFLVSSPAALGQDAAADIADGQYIYVRNPINTDVVNRVRRKDGSYIWLEGASRLVIDAETGTIIEGVSTLRDFARQYAVNYPLLMDEKGAVTGQYAVSGYPHVYLIDRGGRVAFDRHGAGAEAELEREIRRALGGGGN